MDSDGKRVKELNFCVSNPTALEIAAKRGAELAKKLYRSSDNYYFWLDDAKDSGCKCDKCKNLSESDQQLTVLNAVLKELRKHNPNARLAYLAYFGAIKPPVNVKPDDGIFLEYAPIERNMKQRLTADSNPDHENIKKLIEFFGKKDAKVLEYWLDNSLFSNWKPDNIQRLTPDNDLIRDDIKYYNSLGFDYISTFACYLGEAYEKLYGEADISGFVK